MIKLICIHCAATPPGMDIGAKEIREWHKKKGWSDIGYSYVIRRNGELEHGRAEGRTLAHAAGFNRNAIAICLVGGVNRQGKAAGNFTQAQLETLRKTIDWLELKYPDAEILGHRDLPNVNKDCPSFDVSHWLATGEVESPRKVTP